MTKLRLTKKFEFEAAHVLNNYDGLCKNIHGHSYKLFVTIIGEPENDIKSPKYGMVLDFKILKEIVNSNIINVFEHSIILLKSSELAKTIPKDNKIFYSDFQPTAENLIIYFANILKEKFPINIELFSLKLFETESSFVEWFANDND